MQKAEAKTQTVMQTEITNRRSVRFIFLLFFFSGLSHHTVNLYKYFDVVKIHMGIQVAQGREGVLWVLLIKAFD